MLEEQKKNGYFHANTKKTIKQMLEILTVAFFCL